MSNYTQHIESCFSDSAGNSGVNKADFNNVLALVEPFVTEISQSKLPLVAHLKINDDVDEIISTAHHMRNKFDTLVVLGTGGSILNPKSLCALKSSKNDYKIYLADSIDPEIFENKIRKLDFERTAFLAISKSGGTLETLSQTLICLDLTKQKLKEEFNQHWFFITDPVDNSFRKLAHEINAKVLDHPREIGGRYSGLTAVGLLPAAFSGLDVAKIRSGALSIVDDIIDNKNQSMVVQAAALHYCLFSQKVNLSVILPYIAKLTNFTEWYCQIVAESLGKEGRGVTPIRAIGPLDQHSQLQLFLDGPKDKFINVITQKKHNGSFKINNQFAATKNFSVINDKTLADILCAEQQATIETLQKRKCPVRHIEIETLNEEVIGALMMQTMLEVILIGKLMKINPFDQPAVELGKVRTSEILHLNKKNC